MRRAVLISALTLLLVACGGAAADDPAADDLEVTTTLSAETDEGDEDEPETATTSAGVGSAVSMASVTIGGETYEFRSTGLFATCNPNLFGGFQVVLQMTDENGEILYVDDRSSGVTIAIPPEGVDRSPTVELTVVAADMEWFANPEKFGAEESQVDSWTIDGNHVEGKATFLARRDSDQSTELVSGTFEATCFEE